jgi:hypothetical protein
MRACVRYRVRARVFAQEVNRLLDAARPGVPRPIFLGRVIGD